MRKRCPNRRRQTTLTHRSRPAAARGRGRALGLGALRATAAHGSVHEIGHTIGLGDEYEFLLPLPKLELPNTPAASQRENVVWKHWIAAATPLPTPEEAQYENTVGLFEGANYSATGWYRPQQSCKMRTNRNDTPFCAVCREWLIKAIYGYRWQAEGFPLPENRIRPLTLIQSRDPQEAVLNVDLGEIVTLQVETLAPASHGLTFQWLVDGQRVDELQLSSESFAADALGAGQHEITVVAHDSTDWVRWDPQHFLSDSTTWQLNVGEMNAVAGNEMPREFALAQNYPNPFNPQTTIRFSLPQNAPVVLAIYSTTGRRIRTIVQQGLPAGIHKFIWDGLNESGEQVASGVYVYQLTAGQFQASRKLILLR